ncbi:MAG: DUF5657 family protein [Patescibacteria group bacterium]
MEGTLDLFSQFPVSDVTLIQFFFKIFAVTFGALMVVYALVLVRQTSILNNTLRTGNGGFINMISWIQLILGVLLLVLSIIFI